MWLDTIVFRFKIVVLCNTLWFVPGNLVQLSIVNIVPAAILQNFELYQLVHTIIRDNSAPELLCIRMPAKVPDDVSNKSASKVVTTEDRIKSVNRNVGSKYSQVLYHSLGTHQPRHIIFWVQFVKFFQLIVR